MGTFMMIGQWYEAREKTLAHVDTEIVDEMKKYQQVVDEMKKIAHEQGYSLGTFRILNPKSMLPYLRQVRWRIKKSHLLYCMSYKEIHLIIDIVPMFGLLCHRMEKEKGPALGDISK